MENKIENATCPVTMTANLIGGRWKLIILYHLAGHTRRFGEIAARIPAISRKVLSQQLKEMEEDGLITRQQFKEIPPRVEYSLSDLGESLKQLLLQVESWGIETMMNARANKV